MRSIELIINSIGSVIIKIQ